VPAFDDPLSPSSPAATRRQWRVAALWWLAGAVVRALLAGLVPLLPDETYYWEWTRRLEGGYFDHPPGIALLLAAGVRLAGDTLLGVRLGPWIAGGVAHAAVIALSAHLGGPRAGARAALLMFVVPLATLGFVLATPDAPFLAALSVAALFLMYALASPIRSMASLVWWALTGAALGVAMLSKYTAVLMPGAVAIACLVHPALRKRFAEPGPYVATVVAGLLFAPVVVWNWFYEWVSFRFQRDGWEVRKRLSATDILARRFALGVMVVVPLAVFAFSAWRRSVEANWPAPIYPAAVALLAAGTARWAHGRWYRAGVIFAGVLLVVVSLQAWRPLIPIEPRRDPIGRAHGWETLAAEAHAARRDPFLDGSVDVWVAANRYQDASELAFHLPDQPTVFALNLASRKNQYDLWDTAHDKVRPGDGLVAVFEANAKGDSLAAVVGTWFREHRAGATVVLNRGEGVVTQRRIWLYRIAVDIPPLGSETW
jgi:4-amino-4-deoxy-L-arabinose transferase-like glycosyltransferase